MSKKVEDLYREALTLTEDERERLALLLHNATASKSMDPEIEKAWIEECERRLAEIDSGAVQAIPAEEVLEEARRFLDQGKFN